MKKVAELEGIELDCWVARAEGNNLDDIKSVGEMSPDHKLHLRDEWGSYRQFLPSSEWAHGGPIIERERLVVGPTETAGEWIAYAVGATISDHGSDTLTGSNVYGVGPTPLIAAMRAYVASKFGAEVA